MERKTIQDLRATLTAEWEIVKQSSIEKLRASFSCRVESSDWSDIETLIVN
jgi:hypothetical protein